MDQTHQLSVILIVQNLLSSEHFGVELLFVDCPLEVASELETLVSWHLYHYEVREKSTVRIRGGLVPFAATHLTHLI